MRGSDEKTGSLFSYVALERRIPASHPLRLIRRILNAALAGLDTDFAAIYSSEGRPSIPPEEDDPGDPPTDDPPRKPDQPHPPETPPMQSKSRNAEVDFKGEKRSDKTDPTKPMRRSPIPTPCFTRNPPARAQLRVSSGRL